jgi:O-phosphoseryl-tRNA synthetase
LKVLNTLTENRGNNSSKVTAWKGSVIRKGNDYTLGESGPMETMDGYVAEVVLKEAKEGMGICGPAAFDELMVLNGNIIGVPPPEKTKLEDHGAVPTGITYAKAFANLAAWKVERSLEKRHIAKRVEMVKDMEQINLTVDAKAFQYILSRKKRIDIKGPVFLRFSFRSIEP